METELFVPQIGVGHAEHIIGSIQPFAEPRVHPLLSDGRLPKQAIPSRSANRIGDWFSMAFLIAAAFGLAVLDVESIGNLPVDESERFENLASMPERPGKALPVYSEHNEGRTRSSMSH